MLLLSRTVEGHALFLDVGGPTLPPTFPILGGSIRELQAELADGLHDDHLPVLLRAEHANKARKGAVAAIEERQAQIGA